MRSGDHGVRPEEESERLRQLLAGARADVMDLTDQVQALRRDLAEGRPPTRLAKDILRRAYGSLRPTIVQPGGRTRSADRFGLVPLRPARSTSEAKTGSRVLHALVHIGLGGSAQLIVDLVKGLPETDQLVLSGRPPETPAYPRLPTWQTNGVPSRSLLQKVRAAFRPDLLHLHYVAGDPRTPWGRSDWRWYHAIAEWAESVGLPMIENVNIPVPPYKNSAIEHYVYVSEYVARRFPSGTDRDRVIFPGSDLAHFQRDGAIPPPSDVLGMVYRLQPEKLDTGSIDPMIRVLELRPGARGIVIGDGPLRAEFQARAAAAGVAKRIEFLGNVPYSELPKHYEQFTVFVAPVVRESFGQVVPFAMSMGIPVAGYHVGALPEIVDDRTLLVPAGDSEALANVLTSLLDQPDRCAEIGSRNLKRAKTLLSLPHMVDAYGGLYRSVIRAHDREPR